MKNLNQKGQAFSVFKLLIAAIVAVFILAFLLQILSQISPPSQGDPTDEAVSKIKSLITKLGTPERTAEVTFTAGTLFRARTIAEKSGALDNDNVCVMASDSAASTVFEGTDGQTIQYTGNSTIKRRLYILCDLEKDIEATISELSGIQAVDEAFNSGSIPCTPDSSSSNKYCVVSIIPTGT